MRLTPLSFFGRVLAGFFLAGALVAVCAFRFVAEKQIALSFDKMNAIYVGFDNPATIAVQGLPPEQVKISSPELGVTDQGKGKYDITATKTGSATLRVEGGGGMAAQEFPVRVKRLPLPVAKLGGRFQGGQIGSGEIKSYAGLIAYFENFDIDARCEIVHFEITHVRPGQDPVTKIGTSGRFSADIQVLFNKSIPGDIYHFDEVKVLCPGYQVPQLINSLVFKIR